ncbi:MAG TPA: hypothetical protein IGS40_06935 [Trichormus sp. M33_DOE_039]|nr:hypothetical protein [Trichormus sp. M33_DOE_039]
MNNDRLKINLADFANKLVEDFQALVTQAENTQTRQDLSNLEIPQGAVKFVQDLTNQINTDYHQDREQQRTEVRVRTEAIRTGLLQRQQFLEQIADLRRQAIFTKPSDRFVLAGRIVDEKTGISLPNVTIKASSGDRKLDDRLGRTVTDKEGYYRLEYSEDLLKEFGEKKPEITIEVLDQNNKSIYQSPKGITFKIGEIHAIDVQLDSNKLPTSKLLSQELSAVRSQQIEILTQKQKQLGDRLNRKSQRLTKG